MGILEKIDEVTSQGLPRVFRSRNDDIVNDDAGGIGTAPLKHEKAFWQNDDPASAAHVLSRGCQIFFAFVNMCIYVAIAAFQKKWKVGPSFMTGAALFFIVEPVLVASLILSSILFYESFKPFRGVVRLMSQIRAAFIVNAFHVGLLLIAALATTISANVRGCKNRENDPNKELKGYTDAMGPFCRNKRAGAAFFWLTFAAWSGSLAWTLLEWYDIRKHPAAQGFVPPAAQQQQDDEVFASRLSQSFYEGDRRLFDAGGDSQAEPYHDPFADQQPLPSYPASYASHVDPYDAIRQSMDQGHRTYYK